MISGSPLLVTAATTTSPVGNYVVSNFVGTLSANNYSFNLVNGTLAVTPTSLIVTPNDALRAYGQTNPLFTGIINGIANNDDITANYSTTATTNTPVGAYPITATLSDPGSKLSNYVVTTNQGTLTITNTSQAISIDFAGTSTNNGTASSMAASEIAGVWRAANWNSTTNQASGTLNGLVDSDGVGTPASITWSASGLGSIALGNTAGDLRMMKGYLDVTNGATGMVSVVNLPTSISSGAYDVIVYFDGANGSSDRVAKFSLGAATFYGMDYTLFSGSFIQASSTSDNGIATPSGNFVRFTNVTGSSFTLTVTPGYANDTNPHAEINGLQIVASAAAQTTVTTNPISQTVSAGDAVSFTAGARSASTLTVQWQVKTNGGSAFVNIAGATNSTLSLTAALTNNASQYQAVFSGGMGTATTTTATLTVNPVAPTIGSIVSSNNQLQFFISGTTGASYVVQATTNLSSANWVSIYTNTPPFTFTDTNATAYPQLFYRVASQ